MNEGLCCSENDLLPFKGDAAGGSDNEDDQEAVDMEAFIESGMLDSATVDVEKTTKKSSKAESGGEIENVRTYDLNITYDKFYQVNYS
jgi:ubiquitin-like-conjugating enzyme ATG3